MLSGGKKILIGRQQLELKRQDLLQTLKEDAEFEKKLKKPLFRGFIGGDTFITKKGFRGQSLDSLWVQNLFDSFKQDDVELAEIALKSSLADVRDVVEGGMSGAAYSIGDYGFFAEQQFSAQYEYLQNRMRGITRKLHHYLSEHEWEVVHDKLKKMANHGKASYQNTSRGDSFAALAIRMNAFQVARVLISKGLDPLVENEKGDDLFNVMKEQYHHLSLQLKDTQDIKERATAEVLVPSVVEHALSEECRLMDSFHFLSEFAVEFRRIMELRLEDIAADKVLQRRAMLRDEDFPAEKLWNIAQLEKAERYVKETVELERYIAEKIKHHEAHSMEFESLSNVLLANYSLVKGEEEDTSAVDEDTSLGGATSLATSKRVALSIEDGGGSSSVEAEGFTGSIAERAELIISDSDDDNDDDGTPYTKRRMRVRMSVDWDNLKWIQLHNPNDDDSSLPPIGPVTQLSERKLRREQSNKSVLFSRQGSAISALTQLSGNSSRNGSRGLGRGGGGGGGVSVSGEDSSTLNNDDDAYDEEGDDSSTINGGTSTAPSTPGEKLRARAMEVAASASIVKDKDELYKKLGVGKQDFGEGRQRGSSQPKTGMLAALSSKEKYAPVLGTFKEAVNEVIMYR